jgi:hypothetical protein
LLGIFLKKWQRVINYVFSKIGASSNSSECFLKKGLRVINHVFLKNCVGYSWLFFQNRNFSCSLPTFSVKLNEVFVNFYKRGDDCG